VLAAVSVNLNEMQLGALISLAYNIGIGHFWRSSVLEVLNLALYQPAANRFLEYGEAGHRVIDGLETRGARERALFLAGMGVPLVSLRSAIKTATDTLGTTTPPVVPRPTRVVPECALRATCRKARRRASCRKQRLRPIPTSADDLNAAELAKLQGA
jgi:hypothetical protein